MKVGSSGLRSNVLSTKPSLLPITALMQAHVCLSDAAKCNEANETNNLQRWHRHSKKFRIYGIFLNSAKKMINSNEIRARNNHDPLRFSMLHFHYVRTCMILLFYGVQIYASLHPVYLSNR